MPQHTAAEALITAQIVVMDLTQCLLVAMKGSSGHGLMTSAIGDKADIKSAISFFRKLNVRYRGRIGPKSG